MSATRDAARIKAALRRYGVRSRGSIARAREGMVGYASLTAAELAVLSLLTQGLTNRKVADQLFISPRTVETHISHMFAKLGVSSRTELALVANELRLPQSPSPA
jgi:DNA-binding NarL/FixJ family response regulator